MLNRKGSKKGDGPSWCHVCQKQLQYKVGGGFYFTRLVTPVDGYPVRTHVGCADEALKDGYRVSILKEQLPLLEGSLEERIAALRKSVRGAWMMGVEGEWRRHYDAELFAVLGIKSFQDLYDA